jgi:hypothetical protein
MRTLLVGFVLLVAGCSGSSGPVTSGPVDCTKAFGTGKPVSAAQWKNGCVEGKQIRLVASLKCPDGSTMYAVGNWGGKPGQVALRKGTKAFTAAWSACL